MINAMYIYLVYGVISERVREGGIDAIKELSPLKQ